jgi:hypothetical protein
MLHSLTGQGIAKNCEFRKLVCVFFGGREKLAPHLLFYFYSGPGKSGKVLRYFSPGK